MANKRYCHLCREEIEEKETHFQSLCEKSELLKSRQEIKELKASINFWKDYVFKLRDIIGNLWWHHPAIDNDKERAYCQAAQQRLKTMRLKENGS